MLTTPGIRDASFVIVRGEPATVSLRGLSKPRPATDQRPKPRPKSEAPPPSVRPAFRGVPAAMLALVLVVIWTAWQWQKARAETEELRRQAELSWSFSDGVLGQLQTLREDAKRADADYKELLKDLAKTRKEGVVLRGELNEAEAQHEDLAKRANDVAGQWAEYSDKLKMSLGSARMQLSEATFTMQSERAAAQQEISALQQQRCAVEREADAYNHKASHLEHDNRELEGDLSSARNRISCLQSEVSSLRSENSRLQSCHSSLESRISCLESELSQARSCAKH